MYKLAFDVYGTLIDTTGVFDKLESFLGDKAAAFMKSWRNKQLEYSFRRGLMNRYTDFSTCTKEALMYCVAEHKVELSIADQSSLMEQYAILPIFPDVMECLQNVKDAGHQIFAFSNGSNTALNILLSNAGILDQFDGIISVENAAMFKPSPLVYDHFCIRTQANKETAWLISGNPFDVMGAVSYGMRAAWVKRSEEQLFDPWDIHPSVTINSLTQLKNTLDEPSISNS